MILNELDTQIIPNNTLEHSNFINKSSSELLKLAGDDKKYQKRTLYSFATYTFFLGAIVVMFPYILYNPTFYCLDANGLKSICSEAEACFDFSNLNYEEVFTSFTSSFKLFCSQNRYVVNMLVFELSSSTLVTCMCLLLSKYAGRKIFIILSWLSIILGTGLLMTFNYWMIMLAFMFLLIGLDLFLCMSYIYVHESMNSVYKHLFTNILVTSLFCGSIFTSITMHFLSSYLYLIAIPGLILTMLGTTFLLITESPKFCYKIRNKDKLYECLTYIAKVNYGSGNIFKKINDKLINEIFYCKARLQSMNTINFVLDDCNTNLCKDDYALTVGNNHARERTTSLLAKLRTNSSNYHRQIHIILLSFIWVNISVILGFYIIHPNTLSRFELTDRLYIYFCSGLFGILYSHTRSKRLLRRKTIMSSNICLLLIVIIAFTLRILFTEYLKGLYWFDIIISLMIINLVGVQIGILFKYTPEIFVVKLKGNALALIMLVFRMGMIATVYLVVLGRYWNVVPIHLSVFTIIMSIISILILPETLEVPAVHPHIKLFL